MRLLEKLMFCVAMSTFVAGCVRTPEEVWLRKNIERCAILRAKYLYDYDTKIFECWRTPVLRMPKLMFKETYKGMAV